MANQIATLALSTAELILRGLPERVGIAAAEACICVLEHIAPKRRKIAERNLGLAGVTDPDHVLRSLRRHLARSAVHIAAGTTQNRIEVRGAEHFHKAKQHGTGVILAGAHIGNFELGGYTHGALHGPVVAAVQEVAEPIDRFLNRRRHRFGIRTECNSGSVRTLLAALKRGEDIALLDDFNLDIARHTEAPFFGRPTRVSTAAARLAALSQAPVVPWICVWDVDRYLLRYDPPLPVTGDVNFDTRVITSWYESVIRQYIDQWFWIVPRWPDACDCS